MITKSYSRIFLTLYEFTTQKLVLCIPFTIWYYILTNIINFILFNVLLNKLSHGTHAKAICLILDISRHIQSQRVTLCNFMYNFAFSTPVHLLKPNCNK